MNAERRQCVDQYLLELTQVPMEILVVLRQVDDGIPDQLSWTMERDVAAALDLEQIDPASRQHPFVGEEMCRLARATKGHHRVVLDEEQRVRPRPRDPLSGDLTLQREDLGVQPAPQILAQQLSSHA